MHGWPPEFQRNLQNFLYAVSKSSDVVSILGHPQQGGAKGASADPALKGAIDKRGVHVEEALRGSASCMHCTLCMQGLSSCRLGHRHAALRQVVEHLQLCGSAMHSRWREVWGCRLQQWRILRQDAAHTWGSAPYANSLQAVAVHGPRQVTDEATCSKSLAVLQLRRHC